MAYGSTVLGALNGLVAAFEAAAPDTTVRKLTVVGNSARQEVIHVGHGDQAVSVVPSLGDQGLQQQREQFTVSCLIEVVRGGTDPDPAVTRVLELLATVGGALNANHTLSGAVMMARLGGWDLSVPQTAKGVKALIPFGVDIDAFTTH